MRLQKTLLWILLSLVAAGMIAGCGRIQPSQENGDPVTVEMTTAPDQPAAGAGTLVFTVFDPAGQPVEAARLEIEGNMTHAGMVPVLAEVTAGADGRYSVPFEWTMSGDWIITVKVFLPDGRSTLRQFPVSVE